MPPCHRYSHTRFLNMFLKAVRVGVLQNRLLQTPSYLAEIPARNREGNKLPVPHQQPLPLALAVPTHLHLPQQGGSRKDQLPWATPSICSLLLQGELSLQRRHSQDGAMLGMSQITLGNPCAFPAAKAFPLFQHRAMHGAFQQLLKLPVKSSAKANCCHVSAKTLTATISDRR